MSLTESPAKRKFDPLSGSLSLSPDSASGATTHTMTISKRFLKTYLKSFYKAKAGLIQSALGGLNLFNHRTHEGPMFIDDRRAL